MSFRSAPDPVRRGILKAATALPLVLPSLSLAAPAWPSGPVQLYVPASPGGGTDAAARTIADTLQKHLRRPFVVVNLPGGGGAPAAEQVRNAKPDGQSLLFYHIGLLAAHRTGAYAYDPLTAFRPVAALPVGGSYALAVSADAPWASAADLVEAARAQPEKISMGVQLRGSSHFMGGLLEKDSGAAFRFVEAGSDGDKLVQLQGGQIDSALINTGGTMPYVEAGKLRVLATIAGTPARDPAVPDVPSLAELGYENAVYGFDFIVLAPPELDPALAPAIHDAFAAAVADPKVAERLDKIGMPLESVPLADTGPRLASTDARIAEMAKLLGLN